MNMKSFIFFELFVLLNKKMRPTELQFRSPKEKTAEYNMPVVTNGGTILLPKVCEKKKHPTFSKSKRFSQYECHAKITGYRVGPGSYSPDNKNIAKSRIRGGHVYRGFHGEKDVSNNGYLLIGNSMIFDPSFVLPSKKSPTHEVNSVVNPNKTFTNTTFHRISTTSTPSKHRRCISTKPRLMSPHIAL